MTRAYSHQSYSLLHGDRDEPATVIDLDTEDDPNADGVRQIRLQAYDELDLPDGVAGVLLSATEAESLAAALLVMVKGARG